MLSRRQFLRWSSLVGCSRALAASVPHGRPAPRASTQEGLRQGDSLPRDYLLRGVQALGEAHRYHWSSAHHGAAVIAGYYFCRENSLDERTTLAVRKNLDEYIASQPDIFAGLGRPVGAAAPAERIPETLSAQIGELRGAGHDAIFGALAVKALADAPELAVDPVVDGVCRLLRDFAGRFSPDDSEYNRRCPLPPYENDQQLIAATLTALERPRPHLAARGVVGVMHWVTHADALVTLAQCGYPEVGRLGYAAHQAFINHPVTEPEAASETASSPAAHWLEAEYWESGAPRRPLRGSWLNGHTLKFPFSLFRLARRLDDPAAARGIDRAPWLVQEFERQGG